MEGVGPGKGREAQRRAKRRQERPVGGKPAAGRRRWNSGKAGGRRRTGELGCKNRKVQGVICKLKFPTELGLK